MTARTAILFACLFSAGDVSVAFTTGGTIDAAARAVSKSPTANRQEWTQGVDIELPNLELLFDRIAQASPLARLVMEGKSEGGFDAIDDSPHPELKWKKMEDNKGRKTVHRIDKADRFQGVNTPLLRFRSTIKGPCIGEQMNVLSLRD